MELTRSRSRIKRILVPLDGSERAEAVLPHVRRILACHDAEVIVLRVAGPSPPDIHFISPQRMKEAERYIRRMEWLLINEGLRARGRVRIGPPERTILDVASEERVSMVAMSTHGRTGLFRVLYGSVAESILRASNVPVFFVRPIHPTPVGGRSRGQIEARRIRRVLVPIDGRRNSLGILPTLKSLLRPQDARVILLRVFSESDVEGKLFPPEPMIDKARMELTGAEIPVDEVFCKGDAAAGIMKACREQDADVIAMASKGRSGAFRMILGSVTETVLRSTEVPMLITRPRKAAHIHA